MAGRMVKLKKYKLLWLALGIIAVLGAAIAGLSYARKFHYWKCVVPLEDGLWTMHPVHGAELIHAWESEDHFVVSYSNQLLYAFDGGNIWQYDREAETLTLMAADCALDHSLGAAGVAYDTVYRGNDRLEAVLYLHADSQRTEMVAWSDQPVSMRTATLLFSDGLRETFDVPVSPQPNWLMKLDNTSVLCVAQREDGMLCAARASAERQVRRSDWFTAAPEDEIDLYQNYHRITTIEDGMVTVQKVNYGHEDTVSTYPVRTPQESFSLCANGALQYQDFGEKSTIDLFAGLTQAQLDTAERGDDYLLVRTDKGQRVYARFHGDWKRFDFD